MGQPGTPRSALLLMAAFSRYDAALQWARDAGHRKPGARWPWKARPSSSPRPTTTRRRWARAAQDVFHLHAAAGSGRRSPRSSYKPTRGKKSTPGRAGHAEPRPLNLDPGYLTLGKLVLASTKDFAHRIYLQRGIYAEVTLIYRHHRWQHHEFTFADYRRVDYQQFFSQCREWLHRAT